MPYVHERKQFGQPIGEFQLMQGKLADMYTTMNACRSYVYFCGKAADRGEITRQDAAGCLMFAAEKATWMALEAIQALGGNGYINDYPCRPPPERRQALRDRRRDERDPPDADRPGAVRADELSGSASVADLARGLGSFRNFSRVRPALGFGRARRWVRSCKT